MAIPSSSSSITGRETLFEQSQNLTNELILERQLRVADAARKALEEENGRFVIRLKIPTGKKIANPFGNEELDEFKEEGEHEIKTYHFHKITAADWGLCSQKKGELNNEASKPIDKQDNTKIADLNNRIYEFLAIKFLGMKHDEYVRAEWDDVRLAIDACNHITEWQSQEIAIDGTGIAAVVGRQRPPSPPLSSPPSSLLEEHQQRQIEQQEEEEDVSSNNTKKKKPRSSSKKQSYDYDL